MIGAVALEMNDVGGVPPVFINQERVVLDNGAGLIEPGGFVMLRRLVEINVGAEE